MHLISSYILGYPVAVFYTVGTLLSDQRQIVELLQREAILVPDAANMHIQTYSLCRFRVATHLEGIESLEHSWFSSSENSLWRTLWYLHEPNWWARDCYKSYSRRLGYNIQSDGRTSLILSSRWRRPVMSDPYHHGAYFWNSLLTFYTFLRSSLVSSLAPFCTSVS